MWATRLRGVLQFFTILRTLSPYNPCNAYNAYVLNSLHRFIASLMPYYNVVSRGWKLPSPDRCSLSLASPAQPARHIHHQCSLSLASKAQPGRDIYHLRTSVHSAWPAQRSLEGTFTTSGLFTQNGQPSPDCSVRAALPGSAKPSQPGQASLVKLARKARSLLRLG